ncbi:FGGY-family carbohydrate kinase [Shewanella sp. JM162201]|uniref:FGGY-family carbohydrate kinase n=1 Tax=Shewanella jiangmenensis TaxID=2837387 RepID=A0ABS5V590_9GAMM|nr:FGGY-family carbohydrate kinase [Shewanella jiangmenensis]MBT1445626.1 FGGY-family carbohydrate kinase [Shewanella jiangmenensis]
MSKAAYFLALDYGTQSTRALVFDCAGSLIARAAIPNRHCREGEGEGASVQSGDYCFNQLVFACQKLFAEHPLLAAQICAVTLTTQRASTVLMDESGKALSDIFFWSERRLAKALEPMDWWYRLGFSLIGMGERIAYLRRAANINLIRELMPGAVDKAPKIGLLSGYLNARLGGRLIDSVASQVAYLPFDYRRLEFANARSWRWQALGCRPSQMVSLCKATDICGELSPGFAALTGLATGLPLVAGGADKACEAFASGAGDDGVLSLSLGSAATVSLGLADYLEVFRYLPAFPSLQQGQYLAEIQLERGFWLLSWALEQFGTADVEAAKQLGISPEAYVMQSITKVPPGADGLMLCPYWAQGVIYPGPEARGIIAGFSPEHSRAHLYRALVEGILLTLARGAAALIKKAGKTSGQIKVLRVSGGGSESDVVMQLAADIFNLPAERLSEREASSLGAAMCAAVAMGEYESLPQARQNMAKSGRRFEPQPEQAQYYRALSRRHAKLYPALKTLFKDRVMRPSN